MTVICFDCGAEFEISNDAIGATCPECGSPDLLDAETADLTEEASA